MLELTKVTISFISGNIATYIVTEREKDRIFNFVSRYKQDHDDEGIRLDPFYCLDSFPQSDVCLKPIEVWINIDNIETLI